MPNDRNGSSGGKNVAPKYSADVPPVVIPRIVSTPSATGTLSAIAAYASSPSLSGALPPRSRSSTFLCCLLNSFATVAPPGPDPTTIASNSRVPGDVLSMGSFDEDFFRALQQSRQRRMAAVRKAHRSIERAHADGLFAWVTGQHGGTPNGLQSQISIDGVQRQGAEIGQ